MGERKNVIKKGVLLGGLALFLLFAKTKPGRRKKRSYRMQPWYFKMKIWKDW